MSEAGPVVKDVLPRDERDETMITHTASSKNRQKAVNPPTAVDEDEVPVTPDKNKSQFYTGDQVEALYEDSGEWFRGKVIYVQYNDAEATHYDIKFNDYGKIQKATPKENVRTYDCEHEHSMQKVAYTPECPVMDEAPYDCIEKDLIQVSKSSKNRRSTTPKKEPDCLCS